MKRTGRPETKHQRSGIVDKDLTAEQLAGIGRVAIAYNEAEVIIHIIFNSCVGVEADLMPHVASRIYGIDGHIEVILVSLKSMKCPSDVLDGIRAILGEGEFRLLKKYRDAVVHARVKNAPEGIAVIPFKKGKSDEVLLSVPALAGLFERLEIVRLELLAIARIATTLGVTSRVKQYGHHALLAKISGTPNADDEADRQACEQVRQDWIKCLNHRTRRLALPRLPEFPDH